MTLTVIFINLRWLLGFAGRTYSEFVEYFGDIKPCTTMIEVSRLFTPEALVEIEADAVITD